MQAPCNVYEMKQDHCYISTTNPATPRYNAICFVPRVRLAVVAAINGKEYLLIMAHNMKIIVHTICRLEKVCTDSLFAPTPVTKPYSSKRRAVHSTILSLSTAINEIGL